MKLPSFAINNYQFVLIIVTLFSLFGIFSFINMPRSEDPVLNAPYYNVVVIYPGVAPEDMEELVVNPIEDELHELDNISFIRTRIEDGLAIIAVEGIYGIDIDEQFDEVNASVNTLKNELPDDIYSIEVTKFSPLDVLIMQLALSSANHSYGQLYKEADRIGKKLRNLPGVRKVEIEAYPEEEIRIALDMEKMAGRNVSLGQVLGVLRSNNSNIPAGALTAGNKSYTIKTSGSYKSIDEIGNTVVAASRGKVVYLKDIAKVSMDYEEERWQARMNGKNAVFLSITQKEGVNILQVTERIEESLQPILSELPGGMQLEKAFVQAPAVKDRINGFFGNLLQGILLVGLVIFLFLGIRPSLIIMTVIPLSILMAVGMLNVTDFGLQQISIAGLVIALGLLVDNGIVVLENIIRFYREGHSLREAAILGTKEVGTAVISSTITTLLAFFPLTQLGGGTGEFLRSLPLIVIYALVASLLLALTVTPLLSGKFLGPTKGKKESRFNRLMDRFIQGPYDSSLRFALKRPWILVAASITLFAGSLMLFPSVGVSFFPTADKPMLLIDIESPEGSDIEYTDQAVQFVEQLLLEQPEVESYAANTGHGNPQVYYNRIPEGYKKTHGQLVVMLKSWEPEKFYKLVASMRKAFESYNMAKISISELKNGPPFEAPIEIKILGNDLDTLKSLAGKLEGIIANTPGTLNVQNPFSKDKINIKVAYNRDKASMLGIMLGDADLAIRTSISGQQLEDVTMEDGYEYPMTLRMMNDGQNHLSNFDKIHVASVTGVQVPLRQFADLAFDNSASKLEHFNTSRSISVTADVVDPDRTSQITGEIIAQMNQLEPPRGYSIYVAGEFETQQSSFGNLGFSLLSAMILIFAVLVLQFRSMKQPLIVFSAIPFAFVGSIVTLYITGWSFSFFAFVGFTSLVGIVVNNSIIMVDYTNHLLTKGFHYKEAIIQAGKTRFKPILLTTITTILGLLPLTLSQSGLWSPLGWTIIGGMVTSTLLVLLLVPILYQWFTTKPIAVSQ